MSFALSSVRQLSLALLVVGLLGESMVFAQAVPPKPGFDPSKRRGMVADVAGRPITHLDLERLLRGEGLPREEWAVNAPRALAILIDDKLLDIKAELLGIDVTDDEVQRLLERQFEIARQRGAVFESIESFIVAEYKRFGDTERELRERIRKQRRRIKLLYQEAYEQVYFSPAELRAYYKAHRKDFKSETTHRVRFLVLLREAPVEQKLRDDSLKKDIESGLGFEEIAKKYKNGVVPDLSEILDSELDDYRPPLPGFIRELEPGSMSPLVQLETNTTIIFVESRESGTEQPFASAETQKQIRDKLQSKLRQRQYQSYLGKLRKEFPVATFLD